MTREITERTIELRKKLHSMPEASMNETETKKTLMRFIGENTKLEITDKGKWFYVLKRAEKENADAIAFRADMDAVCGKDGKPGHYCGHDGHSAILAGFAMWLDGVETDKDVYLIFQPAEEIGKGAAMCAGLLAEKQIKYIFGMHNIPGSPEKNILIRKGTFACASTGLEITMTGTPSHAGYPEAGRNPGYALARLLLAVQELTTRINEEKGFALMTLIGMDIGSANYGVCASEGTLRMTVRAEKESIFEEYVSRIRALAEAEAEVDGIEIKIEEIERFPATENCDEACDIVAEAANANGYAVLHLEEPMRWSEDFGTYLKTCDGAFFGIGDGCEYAQLHTETYEFPDEITETALNMFAEIVSACKR